MRAGLALPLISTQKTIRKAHKTTIKLSAHKTNRIQQKNRTAKTGSKEMIATKTYLH
jgi:hypothetical protein